MMYLKEKAELLLKLDILAYFPEFSHNGSYRNVGDFICDYNSMPRNKRPVTMFNGYKSDEISGVSAFMKKMLNDRRICELEIIADSSGSEMFNSVCLAEDHINADGKIIGRDIYIIIGGNYRAGEFLSPYGKTSTWQDNFIGAAVTETYEQKSILCFYDRALKKALSDENITDETKITVTVSGHSKAGNLAQYITLMRDSADRCYSFDGQGFSEDLFRRYHGKIRRNGHKIINIYPDVSIAGCLLLPVKNSQKLYIKTDFPKRSISPVFYHIPVNLLDDKGHLRDFSRNFHKISDILHDISVYGVGIIKILPFIDEKKALSHIGKAVMYYFKNNKLKALRNICDKNVLAAAFPVMMIAGFSVIFNILRTAL